MYMTNFFPPTKNTLRFFSPLNMLLLLNLSVSF